MSTEFMKKLVSEDVKINIDMLFTHMCEEYNIPYGDITPKQNQRLSDIEENLTVLLVEFINQNI